MIGDKCWPNVCWRFHGGGGHFTLPLGFGIWDWQNWPKAGDTTEVQKPRYNTVVPPTLVKFYKSQIPKPKAKLAKVHWSSAWNNQQSIIMLTLVSIYVLAWIGTAWSWKRPISKCYCPKRVKLGDQLFMWLSVLPIPHSAGTTSHWVCTTQ
jgi:hypothetical protein